MPQPPSQIPTGDGPLPLRRDLPLRILIVEDDPFTQTILRKRLAVGGYVIDTADNGREALAKLDTFRPDLILSDWMMPEMDGRELCARVKQQTTEWPIYFILLTARDADEDKVFGLDTGADEYLIKPCEGKELMARIRAAERILRLQQALAQSNDELNRAMGRLHAELAAASQIQRNLLPQSLPELAGYEFRCHYQPSTMCSGDFYEALELDDGRILLVIGDVSGHGTPAMVAMAMTHMLLHMEALQSTEPTRLLAKLNNLLCDYLPTQQYVTMFAGLLEPGSGRITYSSAGHNPPLLLDPASGLAEFLPRCEGFPLKLIGPDVDYQAYEARIEPGQTLLLYTDGLLDIFNPEGEPLGNDGLLAAIRRNWGLPMGELLQHLLRESEDYRQGLPLEDDQSMMLLMRAAGA